MVAVAESRNCWRPATGVLSRWLSRTTCRRSLFLQSARGHTVTPSSEPPRLPYQRSATSCWGAALLLQLRSVAFQRPISPFTSACSVKRAKEARRHGDSVAHDIAAATVPACPSTLTLSQRSTTFPSGPIRYVVRTIPIYDRP